MTRVPVEVRPDEPELGLQRWCGRCEEWWPLTDEYWQTVRRPRGVSLVCRACQRGQNRRCYEARRDRDPVAIRGAWRARARVRRQAARARP